MKGERGFTLLEMLVALAVFSLAALALVRLQGVTLRTAADLDSKALGQIVARNLMVDVQSDPVPFRLPRCIETTGLIPTSSTRSRKSKIPGVAQ